MQQLIRAQPQDLDNLRVETLDRTLRERANDVIERGPPALHAGRDFRGERAIAVVGERGSRAAQWRWADRPGRQKPRGGCRRRRRAPARSWRRRQAPASRRPDGRQETPAPASASCPRPGSRRSGGHPVPVATSRSSPRAATIVPGGPSIDCAATTAIARGSIACRRETSGRMRPRMQTANLVVQIARAGRDQSMRPSSFVRRGA